MPTDRQQYRDRSAFIQRQQEQIGKDKRQDQELVGLAAGLDFLQRGASSFQPATGGPRVIRDLLHGGDGLSRRNSVSGGGLGTGKLGRPGIHIGLKRRRVDFIQKPPRLYPVAFGTLPLQQRSGDADLYIDTLEPPECN